LRTYTHAWPLFITVLPATLDLRDVEAYIPEVDTLYSRRERFASLVDTSAVTSLPGGDVRRRLADWQNATIESIGRYNVFSAIVAQSSVIRGALTAMNWIFRPPNEQVAVATFTEGFVRCLEKLRADGHPAPSEIERMAYESPVCVEDTLTSVRSARVARLDEAASPPWRIRRG
jgi:hypothetical protein